MFIIRRLHGLFRFYSFILLCGLVMVGVDYDMQAKAVGKSFGDYAPDAYLRTLQWRLGGPEQARRMAAAGDVPDPEAEVTSPLDVAFQALRGLSVAKAHLMGQDIDVDEVALLPPPAVAPSEPSSPVVAPVVQIQDSDAARPCVRRGNVLSC